MRNGLTREDQIHRSRLSEFPLSFIGPRGSRAASKRRSECRLGALYVTAGRGQLCRIRALFGAHEIRPPRYDGAAKIHET